MANTVRIRKLSDGPREAVIHLHLKSDGASGELTDQVVVDVSTLVPVPVSIGVRAVWYAQTGFESMLEFDATVDTPIWRLPQSTDTNFLDFGAFGVISSDAGAGATGDVILTTTGFTSVEDEGTLILRVIKKF